MRQTIAIIKEGQSCLYKKKIVVVLLKKNSCVKRLLTNQRGTSFSIFDLIIWEVFFFHFPMTIGGEYKEQEEAEEEEEGGGYFSH